MQISDQEMETERCSNCEEASCEIRCEQCQAAYCKACGEVLHKSAARKLHTMVALEGTVEWLGDCP